MTAQIVAGTPHMYHGGIRPIHIAWLSENDHPAWILEEVGQDIYGNDTGEEQESPPPSEDLVVWIPSAPEHILEDGILLLAVHALRDKRMLDAITLGNPELHCLTESGFLDLQKLPSADLADLRETCSRTELGFKLVLSVLGGSSLESQLPVLERYQMQVEVCTVSYSRIWGGFVGPAEAQAHGSLRASWSSAGPTPDRYRAVNLTSLLPGALTDDDRTPHEDPDDLAPSPPASTSGDPARYLGFAGERLRWVEEAIETTTSWAKEADDEASVDIMFSNPGEFDYDAATDRQSAVKNANGTLEALETEKKEILARQALIQRDTDAGKYDDDR